MSKSEFSHQEQGFTLVEVLVAIIITTLFISVSMQALVIAAVFKVRARQYAEATTWIQKDLDSVRFAANATSLFISSRCTANTYANGFAQALITKINTDYPQPTNMPIGGKTFRLTRTYNTDTTSTPPPNTAPFNVLKLTYQVQEWNGSALVGSPKAIINTEVIPDAAFKCP